MIKLIYLSFLILAIHYSLHSQIFTKVTSDPVVSDDRYSEGSSWGDVNNDGHLDLFIPDLFDDKKNILFINNGDGSFYQVKDGFVVTDVGTSSGGSFGDFDNDGDLDLFVSNYFGNNNFLYVNNGSGVFSKDTTGAIVTDGGFSFGSSVVDYDNDGFLDIYVINGAFTTPGANNFLYKNNGDGTFSKITTGAIVNDGQHSSSSAWCDYDNDGDQDLFVANGATGDPAKADNVIYKNNGNGTFTEINPANIGIDHSYSSNGSWGDFDNDGDFDLFVTNFFSNNNILYINNGNGTFTKVTNGIVVNDGGDSVSSSWSDYDNDGDLDLYVTNDFNENNNLYENEGSGKFNKISVGDLVNDGGRSNGATWADYNNDGFLDLFVPNGERPVSQSNILYRNNGSFNNNWINIKCVGVSSNNTAIGTKIKAKALINGNSVWQLRQVSGCTGFNAQNSFNIEFGFGDGSIIDSLIIEWPEWPSSLVEVYVNVNVDMFYEALEGVGLNPILTSVQSENQIPANIELYQNYPNPFNPTTSIKYSIDRRQLVTIKIYDLLGNELSTLVNEEKPVGNYKVDFDATEIASGIYFYKLLTSEFLITKKMIYNK
jgi:hypothetical protein